MDVPCKYVCDVEILNSINRKCNDTERNTIALWRKRNALRLTKKTLQGNWHLTKDVVVLDRQTSNQCFWKFFLLLYCKTRFRKLKRYRIHKHAFLHHSPDMNEIQKNDNDFQFCGVHRPPSCITPIRFVTLLLPGLVASNDAKSSLLLEMVSKLCTVTQFIFWTLSKLPTKPSPPNSNISSPKLQQNIPSPQPISRRLAWFNNFAK